MTNEGLSPLYVFGSQEGDSVKEVTVDFRPPFKRINMIEGIEQKAGIKIPQDLAAPGEFALHPSSLASNVWSYGTETNKFLSDFCEKNGINCPAPRTTTRLLDKVANHI